MSKEFICKESYTDNGGYLEPVKDLIRCKDCKFHRKQYLFKYSTTDGELVDVCRINMIMNVRKETDFCSRAERRETDE